MQSGEILEMLSLLISTRAVKPHSTAKHSSFINFLSLLVLLFLPLCWQASHSWIEFYEVDLYSLSAESQTNVAARSARRHSAWRFFVVTPTTHESPLTFYIYFYLLQFLLYGILNMLMLQACTHISSRKCWYACSCVYHIT